MFVKRIDLKSQFESKIMLTDTTTENKFSINLTIDVPKGSKVLGKDDDDLILLINKPDVEKVSLLSEVTLEMSRRQDTNIMDLRESEELNIYAVPPGWYIPSTLSEKLKFMGAIRLKIPKITELDKPFLTNKNFYIFIETQ